MLLDSLVKLLTKFCNEIVRKLPIRIKELFLSEIDLFLNFFVIVNDFEIFFLLINVFFLVFSFAEMKNQKLMGILQGILDISGKFLLNKEKELEKISEGKTLKEILNDEEYMKNLKESFFLKEEEEENKQMDFSLLFKIKLMGNDNNQSQNLQEIFLIYSGFQTAKFIGIPFDFYFQQIIIEKNNFLANNEIIKKLLILVLNFQQNYIIFSTGLSIIKENASILIGLEDPAVTKLSELLDNIINKIAKEKTPNPENSILLQDVIPIIGKLKMIETLRKAEEFCFSQNKLLYYGFIVKEFLENNQDLEFVKNRFKKLITEELNYSNNYTKMTVLYESCSNCFNILNNEEILNFISAENLFEKCFAAIKKKNWTG